MSSRSKAVIRYAVLLVLIIGVGLDLTIPRLHSEAGKRAAAVTEFTVTVNEGTNFSVAASPDGHTLAIDLLGSLWTLPAQGGTAKLITQELLEARNPSFSPDGKQIVFEGFVDTDDWDLWTIGSDGSGLKRLTSGPSDDLEPAWSHDGTRIAFSSDRNRNYDVWILDLRCGQLKQLTNNPAQDYFPAWSPDDKEIAFVSNRPVPGGPAAEPGTPPAMAPTSIWAINLETGAERLMASGKGRLSAPSWTPDGKQVLYGLIGGGAANLELSGKTVVSGEDVFPYRPQWLPDGAFLYTADGKIKKRTLGGDKAETIEFSATTLPLHRPVYTKRRHDYDSRAPRKALGIVRPVVSPDGKQVAFAALGDIWTMNIGSKPKRLTSDRFLDADPAWSPDGTKLVFSTDRAETGNLDLWIHDMKTGEESRLTREPLADYGANWSPDGKRIAFISMLPHQQGAAIDVVDLATGKITQLYRSAQRIPSNPTWSADGNLLLLAAFDQYSERFREGFWKWMVLPVDGGKPRILDDVLANTSIVSGIDEGPIWSPDGTKVALVYEGQLTVVDVDSTGAPVGPFRKLTAEASSSPSWPSDSQHIMYLATDHLKLISADGSAVQEVPLDLEYQQDIPTGRVVVHAGHLWNGVDQKERSDVDIVIEGNRIKSVQPHDAKLHSGNVVDASGRTVIPGLIEMHGHYYREYGEALGRLDLAYGVTTNRDPAGMAYRSLEIREATDAGVREGPRFYFSAPAMDGARMAFAEMHSVTSFPQLELEMERDVRLGYDLFKLYVTLPEEFQKRAVEFGHQHGIPSTSHWLYPAVEFGEDGTEHIMGRASALGNVYEDQMQLMLKSGMEQSPTLTVGGGFVWQAVEDPTLLDDERLKVLSPEWAVEPTRLHVEHLRQEGAKAHAIAWERLARLDKAILTLARSGSGQVIAGTDTPNQPAGVVLHSEIELYVRGGLTPFEALQTATINGAKALGAEADLGSIEPGKLADMVIVDGDPLVHIEDARKVITVIKNGRVYTMKMLLSGTPPAGLTSTEKK